MASEKGLMPIGTYFLRKKLYLNIKFHSSMLKTPNFPVQILKNSTPIMKTKENANRNLFPRTNFIVKHEMSHKQRATKLKGKETAWFQGKSRKTYSKNFSTSQQWRQCIKFIQLRLFADNQEIPEQKALKTIGARTQAYSGLTLICQGRGT